MFIKSLLTILLAALSFNPTTVVSSIQPLQTDKGRNYCTTFSINQAKHYWMTASHCVHAELPMWILGEPATLVEDWEDLDVAVLQGTLGAPALSLAQDVPKIGDEVRLIGFGGGNPSLVYYRGWLANAAFAPEAFPYPQFLYDMKAIGGHSGSPVLNIRGEVIGVLQWGLANGAGSGGTRFFELVSQTSERWSGSGIVAQ